MAKNDQAGRSRSRLSSFRGRRRRSPSWRTTPPGPPLGFPLLGRFHACSG